MKYTSNIFVLIFRKKYIDTLVLKTGAYCECLILVNIWIIQ